VSGKPIRLSNHARERMRERNITWDDLRAALADRGITSPQGIINLEEVQHAVEKRFGTNLAREFKEIREAAAAVCTPN